MNNNILESFNRCLKYQKSATYLKPLIDPKKFLQNQIRVRFPKQLGTVDLVDAFHLDKFSVVSGEVVSEGIACYGIIKPNLTGAFLNLIKPGQTVVDIGMHLGYFSTLFAHLVKESGSVHSFEPTPSTRNLASVNTNRFSNITIHPNAVWSHRESMEFHDYGIKYMAFNSVTNARLNVGIDTLQKFQVVAISIDEFRKTIDTPISLIKIDAETAEQQIITGGANTFQTDRPIVTLEVGDEASCPGKSRQLIQMMTELDYRSWEFENHVFSQHRLRDHYEYDNLIFAPSNLKLNQ